MANNFKYDPLQNNFTTFEAVETPKVTLDLPLMNEPMDISDWAIKADDKAIIVKPNLPEMFDSGTKQRTVETPQSESPQYKESSAQVSSSKGSETLSKLIDEVSDEQGFEGLKDPETKKLLMLQAQRESSFNPKARAKGSTASGYFQFIDGTRSIYSSTTRDEFMNNPKEQIRTAFKYLKDIHKSSNAKKLLEKGYNKAQVTALGWWYPDSMRMILNGENNFSKGGYSIKKALEQYA